MKRSVRVRATLLFPLLILAALSIVGSACGKNQDGSPAQGKPGVPADTASGQSPASGAAKELAGAAKIPVAPSRGPERAVYSLIDNRLSGHIQRKGGLVIPAGSAGFVKYMRFRKSKFDWKIRAKRDGQSVAVMKGKVGRIDVPLTAEQASLSPTLRLRVYNRRARALTIRINGARKREITQQMTRGWSTVTTQIAEKLLRSGENEISLLTGRGHRMALAWVQIGGHGFGDDTPVFYDKNKNRLVLPGQGGLTFYVMTPEGGRVTGDLDHARCRVAVEATADDGSRVTGELVGNGSAVDLSDLAGKPVRLDLTGTGCDVAHLSDAALVVPGSRPKIKRGKPPKYAILWIMDSLRADRVRIFEPTARPEVPAFERLAATSAVFVQNYVQGNESRVSHASIWSALYPVKHRMYRRKARLAAKWTTIDEVMRGAGMFTSGVSANGYVAKKWGFGRAWDRYRNHIHEGGGLKGKHVFGKAIASIQGMTKPWFLYLGTIDTHVSWYPKEPWIWQYHARGYKGRFARRFSGHDAGKKLELTDAEIAWVRAIYDSNVSYQDKLLGQLLDMLDEWGIADQTMIIITADHGDEQWEAGRVGHGGSLRETLIHVPLLIHYPPMFPPGKIREGAEVVDIVPTIADVLGVAMDPEWQGESLVPLANGIGQGYPRMSFASQYEGAHAARMGPWKIRVAGSGQPKVYNLAREPNEDVDRAGTNPIARRYLSDPLWLLRAYNTKWRKSRWGNAANVRPRFAAHFGE
ncbi:MAG: sulfatase [Proteobacteria bacterium]|nr:sulfatase [Pseudomonadota bacterium]